MDLYDWKPDGDIYLFRFINGPKFYKGQYQLDFSGGGRKSLVRLTELLRHSDAGFKRTVPLQSPTQKHAKLRIGNIERYQVKSWNKMVVQHSNENLICIKELDDILVLLIGGEKLKEFHNLLTSIEINEEGVVNHICNQKDLSMVIW